MAAQTPVLVYNLNLGGGLVSCGDQQPEAVDFMLKVVLPEEGVITVRAETVYRHETGIAVRFVDMDRETRERLGRTVDAQIQQQPPSH